MSNDFNKQTMIISMFLIFFIQGDQLDDKIDFIVCMGGDGTLLHASSLFQVRKKGR